MNKSLQLFKKILIICALAFALVSPVSAQVQPLAVQNLSFKADIYGDSTPENIEYVADLNFYNWGGYGTNAHVFRALLQGGDQIAYGVSTNDPNSFTFNVSAQNSVTPVILTITNAEYSTGIVTMPSTNQLNYVWDVNKSGFHLLLHKIATLISDPDITAKYYIKEIFSIENLGPYFDLNSFSEYYHMDDIARLRDYNNNGVNETLLAINNYSTSGYPVFGKVYLTHQNLTVDFVSDGVYATVNSYPVQKSFSSGISQEITEAAYVTGLAKDSTAENQVATDAKTLLDDYDINTPLLSLPFPHSAIDNGLAHIWSYFDHEYPIYDAEPSAVAGTIMNFTGVETPGTLSSCIAGESCYSGHDGIDFSFFGNSNKIGKDIPVLAASAGTVSYEKSDCSGNVVKINQGRYQTVYYHLQDDSYLKKSGTVNLGDRIGTVGHTGTCQTGDHLHFGVFYDQNNDGIFSSDEVVDPYGWRNQCSQVTADPWTISFQDNNNNTRKGATSGWLWDFSPPICTIKPAGTGQILSTTDGVNITFPADAISNPATIAYNIAPELGGESALAANTTVNAPGETTIATGHTFQVTAIYLDGISVPSFVAPVELSVTYDNSDIGYGDESTLKLYQWDNVSANWTQLTTTLDTVANQAGANIDQPGIFSLRAQPLNLKPSLISVSPSEADTNGDISIIVTGENFISTPSLNLGMGSLDVTYNSSSSLTATIPAKMAPGVYDLTLRNPDGQIAILPDAFTIKTLIYLPLIVNKSATQSISIPISADNQDSYEDGTNFNLSGDGNHNDWVGTESQVMTGWIFNNLQIPKGAVITNSYMIFRGYGFGDATPRISGFAEDNPASFAANGSNKPSLRPTTSHVVDWTNTFPFAWTMFQTPDLSSIIQEIINRFGWIAGNSIGIKASNPSGTGTNWCAIDYAGGSYTTLYVTYTMP